jgi:Icc-related predicted phosphoesterase
MKITVVSDLHLEFAPVKLIEGADVLLLAGDIVPAAVLDLKRTDKYGRRNRNRVDRFCDEELSKFKEVYHIMGNHEHYHGLWEQTASNLQAYWARKAPHVKFLEKQHVQIRKGVSLWGGTFWTDFMRNNPAIMNIGRMGMNDYNLIHTFAAPRGHQMYGRNFRKIQPEMIYEDHLAALDSLTKAIETQPSDHWIVMTHHAPTYKSIDKRFGNDPMNYCYASDLDQFLMDHPQINIWVHGHTHTSHMYHVGETMVICNPRGYTDPRGNPENPTFDSALYFEIKNGKDKNNASNKEANTPGT